MRWRIHYSDGVWESSDGSWEDAPVEDVQVVKEIPSPSEQKRGKTPVLHTGGDYYIKDGNKFYAGYLPDELIKVLAKKVHVKRGKLLSNADYEAVWNQAVAD